MGGGEIETPRVALPPLTAEEKPFNVLVTSFGPFPTKDDLNTSHLVAKLLPSSLTFDLPHEVSNETGSMTGHARPHHGKVKVQILNPTADEGQEGVPVEYAEVRSYVAELYDQNFGTIAEKLRKQPVHKLDPTISDEAVKEHVSSKKPVDLIVHLGMADGWDFISVERSAYKQGFSSSWWGPLESKMGYYMIPDNAGRTILNAGPCPWLTTPMGLQTAFDVDNLVANANMRLHQYSSIADPLTGVSRSKHIPVKAHAEPGSYCCGFIYYESLAHCWIREKDPDVLFCHVPGYKDDGSLRDARDAIIAVIKEAVTQLLARKESTRSG